MIGYGVLGWDHASVLFLLNLAFSTQAAYAAPLILLAQNRQAERDRMRAEEDRLVNQRTQAEAEFLARELAASRPLRWARSRRRSRDSRNDSSGTRRSAAADDDADALKGSSGD